jgi:hypothetical protein
LFIAAWGESGSILKATSDDNWDSVYIHTAYNAACTNDGSTAVAIAGNDVMIYCSNNFGAAPYNVSVVPNALISQPGALSLSSSIVTTGLTPEGIEFDRAMNRVIISSLNGGDITGAAASAMGIDIDQSNSYLYASGTSQVSIQLLPISIFCHDYYFNAMSASIITDRVINILHSERLLSSRFRPLLVYSWHLEQATTITPDSATCMHA